MSETRTAKVTLGRLPLDATYTVIVTPRRWRRWLLREKPVVVENVKPSDIQYDLE